MKQSAAKSLGVAALGAAFAAAAAGTASAAPAGPAAPSVPNAAVALDTVTQTVPLEQAAQVLPVGGAESLMAGERALSNGLHSAHPAVDRVGAGVASGDLPAESIEQAPDLLGGLPRVESRLPVAESGLNGVPLG